MSLESANRSAAIPLAAACQYLGGCVLERDRLAFGPCQFEFIVSESTPRGCDNVIFDNWCIDHN